QLPGGMVHCNVGLWGVVTGAAGWLGSRWRIGCRPGIQLGPDRFRPGGVVVRLASSRSHPVPGSACGHEPAAEMGEAGIGPRGTKYLRPRPAAPQPEKGKTGLYQEDSECTGKEMGPG